MNRRQFLYGAASSTAILVPVFRGTLVRHKETVVLHEPITTVDYEFVNLTDCLVEKAFDGPFIEINQDSGFEFVIANNRFVNNRLE